VTQTVGAYPTCGDLVALVHCDLGSIVRARSLPSADLLQGKQTSAGWVPSAQGRCPLGPSADHNRFGATDDLRLLADLDTRVAIDATEGASRLEFVICDLVDTDGVAWDCCPRSFLREALTELEDELNVHLVTSFEHEFQLLLGAALVPPPLSLEAQRAVDPFPGRVMTALHEAGIEPERFMAERSAHQFEIPVAPASGLSGADRSVAMREVVREVARREGIRASFVPALDPVEQGNGLHIHFSLSGKNGDFPFYDPGRPASLSVLGGRFAAGILAHAPALIALTAPSVVSFLRLRPGRRGAGAVCLGKRNREALLRIPPLLGITSAGPAAQMRLEYRGADAAANPYLALGALIRAGLWGVREELDPPEVLDRDPATLNANEANHFGVGALPASLEEALGAFDENEVVRGWLPPRLYELYVGVKRAEIETVAGQELEEVCRRYAAVY
jgi:glutamine synthetase